MQAEELTLPLGDIASLPHGMHVLSVFAREAEYVPLVQSVHATLPFCVLNLPATQPVQVEPSVPVYPALQEHCVPAVLPSAESAKFGQDEHAVELVEPVALTYLAAAHNVQLLVPGAALNLPASHAKQETPVAPGLFAGQYPALHAQLWIVPLKEGAYEFAGQF